MAKRRNFDNSFLLTASDLTGGHIVYWSKTKGWTKRYTEAEFLSGEQAVKGLEALGARDEAANLVVGPYTVEFAKADSGAFEPVELRERLRLLGPSIDYAGASSRALPLAA